MKKLASLLLALIAMLSLLCVPVRADEMDDTGAEPPASSVTEEPATDEPEDPPSATPDETGAGWLEELQANFNDEAIPFLLSSAYLLIGLAMVIVPYISKSAKFKQVQALYTQASADAVQLRQMLANTDLASLRDMMAEALDKALPDDLAERIDRAAGAEAMAALHASVELLRSQVNALIRGAQNAWGQSPAAVACLTEAPSEEAVKELAGKVDALEGYIRNAKGDEAQAIIDELEGTSHD